MRLSLVRPRDVVLFSGGTLLGLGLTFVSGVIAARWLGPAAYGELSVVRSVYALLAIVAPLGLDLALLRHLGEGDAEGSGARVQVGRFRLIALLVNLMILAATALWVGPWIGVHVYPHLGFALLLSLAILGLPFAADAAILSATLRAVDAVSMQNLAVLVLQPTLRTGLMLILLAAGFGKAGVVVSTAVGAAGAALCMAVGLSRRHRRSAARTVDPHVSGGGAVAAVFRYSLWLAALLLLNNGLRVIDVLALGQFRPAEEVGRYSALAAIAAIIAIPPQALSQTLAPHVARLHGEGDLAGVRAALGAYLRRSVLLASPLFAGLAAFGPWLDLVFGRRYAFDPVLSVVLAAVMLATGCLGQMGVSLTMTGRHRQEFAVLGAGAVLAVVLCWTLTPRFGGVGASSSVLIGVLAVNGGRMALASRFLGGLGVRWIAVIAPPVTCLAMALATRLAFDRAFFHGWPAAIAGVATATLGFVCLYALLLSRDEKRALRGAAWRPFA